MVSTSQILIGLLSWQIIDGQVKEWLLTRGGLLCYNKKGKGQTKHKTLKIQEVTYGNGRQGVFITIIKTCSIWR